MNKESRTGVDVLKDAAERVVTARFCDKTALWIAGGAAVLSVALLSDGSPWALLAIVVSAVVVHRIAKIALYYTHGLGWLPLFGNLLPHTVSNTASPTKPASPSAAAATVVEPRSALVPRLSFSQTWPAAWIVTANVTGAVTLRAGRADTKWDDMPLGVFMFTERGLAFLPESRDKLEQLIGEIPAAVVTQVASNLFEPVEYLERWQNTLEAIRPDPTLAEWMEKGLAQENAFAISWGDLTGVMVGRTHTVLTRRTVDGAQDDFIILDASPSWPGLMMQKRIVADLKDVVFVKLLQPKYDELLPTVRRELATKSEADIGAETSRRAMAWFKATVATTERFVRDAMGETLEGYSWLPNVVANQPWLFEKKST